jgi:hypothetical protein
MLVAMPELPYIDEHETVAAATPDDAWRALVEVLDRTFSAAGASTYARLVGCAPAEASGPRPLAEGSTIPGFRVAEASPPHVLRLEGRHHFSTYLLTFRLEPVDADGTRLRAESRAAFPGWAGPVYRLLVIGTRGHRVLVRRLLSTIRRRAEADSQTSR